MLTVHQITTEESKTFIRQHKLNLFTNEGYEGTKYEFVYNDDKYDWFGIFEDDVMVAIQVAKINDNDIHLHTIQKIPGAPHGVFEAILNYFSIPGYNIHFKAYNKKLKKMYKSLGFTQIKDFNFVKQI